MNGHESLHHLSDAGTYGTYEHICIFAVKLTSCGTASTGQAARGDVDDLSEHATVRCSSVDITSTRGDGLEAQGIPQEM